MPLSRMAAVRRLVPPACARRRMSRPPALLHAPAARRHASSFGEGAGTTFQRQPTNREFVSTLEFLAYPDVALFQVMDEDGACDEKPEDGVYVYGLFGLRWCPL